MRVRLAVLCAIAFCSASACTTGISPFGAARPADVLGGALHIAPPKGYCIDQGASNEAEDRAVVLMGRCSEEAPVAPAVLTLTVGSAGSAAVLASGGQALADYFASAPGRSAVARSGRADDVRVIEAVGRGPAFLLHLNDRDIGTYWRAVVGSRGRLVTVAVTPSDEAPLAPAAGRAVLEETLGGLARANDP